jgi:hypothetical protein
LLKGAHETGLEEQRVDQALEKIAEVIHHPSGGYGAPSWAEALMKELEILDQKLASEGAA